MLNWSDLATVWRLGRDPRSARTYMGTTEGDPWDHAAQITFWAALVREILDFVLRRR